MSLSHGGQRDKKHPTAGGFALVACVHAAIK